MEIEEEEEPVQVEGDGRQEGAAGAWIQTKKIWGSREVLKVYFLNPSVLESWICGKQAMNTATIMAWAAKWNHPFFEKIPKFQEVDSSDNADIRVEFTGKVAFYVVLV